ATHRGARHPACLARRVDLAEPEREAAGDWRRRGRAAPVPLPPRLPGGAREREVRPAGAVRRVAARPPQDARPSPCARAVRAGVGCAVAVTLVNRAWFRVGSERHLRTSRTYGITTLSKRHVT